MIILEESFEKYYNKLEEEMLLEDDDWKYKLLPLGSKEAYEDISEYKIGDFGFYTQDAQYWPDNRNKWKIDWSKIDDSGKPAIHFSNLELIKTLDTGEFAGNPVFRFNVGEVIGQLKSSVKSSNIELLKKYNIKTNKNYELTIDLSKSLNSIKMAGRTMTADGPQYPILFRDQYNNIYTYYSPEKYSSRDLKYVRSIFGRINPNEIKVAHAELGENPVLSVEMISCNLDIQIDEIKDLSPEEKKVATSRINTTKYELIRNEIIKSQNQYRVDKKLNEYYKVDEDDELAGKYVIVSKEKWAELAKKADTFYKSNKLRQKRDRWAVTDGNCIFANAATALLYYKDDIKHGNLLYDSCEGIRGKHVYNDSRWRYATSREILNAKPIKLTNK